MGPENSKSKIEKNTVQTSIFINDRIYTNEVALNGIHLSNYRHLHKKSCPLSCPGGIPDIPTHRLNDV